MNRAHGVKKRSTGIRSGQRTVDGSRRPPAGERKSPPQERGSRGQRPLVSALWSHNTQGTGCEMLSFHCGRMLSRVSPLSATPLHAPLPVRHSPVCSAPPSGVHRTTAGTRLCGVGTVPGRRVFRAARASASLAKSATVSRDASCSMRTRCESSEPLTRRRACWRLQSWLGLVLTDADRQTYPYLVEPVRVVRLSRCLRVGFSRFTRRTIVCLSEGKH